MTETAPRAQNGWLRFAIHYIEMIVAMFVGMFALGFLQSAVGIGSHSGHGGRPDLGYLLMAFNMCVGMALWMRFRKHAWRPILEMCSAMFLPAVPLFPLLWLDVIDGDTLMIASHVAMFPLMLGAMFLRRAEYMHPH
ncbi:hypothetical protein Aph01nite_05840 [Acrocarpospora phusangensis]|uniref:Flagellar biosynthetic protein FliP n=1 Tax=Acrocarpospora phusangensis TaxID=1070424 RepID=A0A919Q4M7_9ACTN|nr:hypothetical protein [Acrocarpospora phusangensis]GIH22274.1 hypothetical protein Aph01nite_05840 [Acrocarpospora phusangensis]